MSQACLAEGSYLNEQLTIVHSFPPSSAEKVSAPIGCFLSTSPETASLNHAFS